MPDELTLKEWLDKNRMSDASLAGLLTELLGRAVKAQHVFNWKRGTMPLWDAGDAIGRLTSGRVSPKSFAPATAKAAKKGA